MTWTEPDPKPCQCTHDHAAVAPFHHGHCCFWPPTQTCHSVEVDAWRAEQDRVHGVGKWQGASS